MLDGEACAWSNASSCLCLMGTLRVVIEMIIRVRRVYIVSRSIVLLLPVFRVEGVDRRYLRNL